MAQKDPKCFVLPVLFHSNGVGEHHCLLAAVGMVRGHLSARQSSCPSVLLWKLLSPQSGLALGIERFHSDFVSFLLVLVEHKGLGC